MMKTALATIRYYVLSLLILLSGLIYLYWHQLVPDQQLLIIRLTQTYGIVSLFLIYFSLVPGPLYEAFPKLWGKAIITRSRRAVGVAAFYYSLLHSLISFFGQLDGFAGVGFLSKNYLISLILGLIALVILSVMTLTSFDYWVKKLGKWWKFIHRFVYVAAWAILIHVLIIGTHFSEISTLPAETLISATAVLLVLEAMRVDRWLRHKRNWAASYSSAFAAMMLLIGIVSTIFLNPFAGSPVSLGVHSQHIALAKQAQQGSVSGGSLNFPTNIPGLNGDRTKRYTVSFQHPDAIIANQDAPLNFQVYDASNGNKVQLFSNVYEKPLHLVVVDSQLGHFSHIHPTLDDNGFNITTQFPHDGVYHLYLNFQPLGAIEQQFAFTAIVGDGQNTKSAQVVDTDLTKIVDGYQVTLKLPGVLKAADMSIGRQTISFTIQDAATKQPATDLKPYLGAFGHLVMINQSSYDYLHVHPSALTPPLPDANGGPTVDFLPLGLYGPIKPGTYRIFAQFNPNNHLIVADFTVKVQ